MLHRRRLVVLLCLVPLALFAAGCGSSSSSPTASGGASTANVGHLPTAKFVLHAGLAFGAFHHFIYEPWKNGDFSGGLFKHKLTTIKAGLAGLFAYHELKLAYQDAKASPTLRHLTAPLNALADRLKSIGSSAKSGNLDTSSLDSANGSISSLLSQAKKAGAPVSEQTPSAGQLATGGS